MAAFNTPRRGDPDSWYPAGVPGIQARWIELRGGGGGGGERVRVVEPEWNGAEPTSVALLLHGWGCNAFHFRLLIPELTRRNIHPVAVDLRGHGLSEKPTELAAYAPSALVEFTRRVIDTLGYERVGLLGHSLGGAIALDTAIAEPARVAWLELINPAGLTRIPTAPVFTRFPVRISERIPVAASHAFAFAALYWAYGNITRPQRGDLEQYFFPTLMPGGRYGVLAYTKGFSWEPRPLSALERLTCPTLVMLGERDRVISTGAVLRHLSRVPQIRVDVVKRAGHVLAEEAVEQVADAAAALARAPNAASRDQAGIP